MEKAVSTVLYGGLVVMFLVLGSILVAGHFVENTYEATVVDKEVNRSGSDSKYLIFTETTDGQVRVFENTDSMLKGKFNSSDMYAAIKEGETYTFTVYGYRIPILSMYENIITFKECESDCY